MRRTLVSAGLLAFSLTAAPAQTNLPPTANGTLPNVTAKPTTWGTKVYHLGNFFRDPEAAIVIKSSLGDIPITLFSDASIAITTNNFLTYVDANRFADSFIHRSVRPQSGIGVIQGGGFTFVNDQTGTVPADAPIVLQPVFSNVRGTIAMARTSTLNSATSQWFINTVNNTSLDTTGGGYAAFGRVNTPAGLAVVDAISALQIVNAGGTFAELPVRNYTSGAVLAPNLIFAPIQRTTRPFTGFNASSNATGVVTATVDGDSLMLNFAGGTGTARITVNATDADGATGGANGFDVTVSANPPQANLANLSTRGFVGSGNDVLIGGFVVRGSPKRLLIRSLGPSLGAFGITSPLANPNITLQSGPNVIASNDNWKATQQAEIEATGFAPTNDLESAMIVTLDPGSYTPIVRGTGDTTGVSIIEVYELTTNETPQLSNIATRGRVGTGQGVMIGGFVIGGTTPKKVLVRVAGPSLAQFGVTGVLANPTLEVNAGGQVIALNNDYRVLPDGSPNPDLGAIVASGFEPRDPLESAVIMTLVPGSYTAVARGVNDTEGVAIVEVYDLD